MTKYMTTPNKKDKPCWVCGSMEWWRNGTGEQVCGVCHPPAIEARRFSDGNSNQEPPARMANRETTAPGH